MKFPICLYSIFSFLAGGPAGTGDYAFSFLSNWLSVLVAAGVSAGFAYAVTVAVFSFGSPTLPPAVVEAISVDLPNY